MLKTKMELFEEAGLDGCLNDSGVTSQNYREHLFDRRRAEHLKKLNFEQDKLVKRRNELMDCWFLKFSGKKKAELARIDRLLDSFQMEAYKIYSERMELIISEGINLLSKIKEHE